MSNLKRRRISEDFSSTVADNLAMKYAPPANIKLGSVRGVANNMKQSASSITRNKKFKSGFSLYELNNLICPPFRTKVTSYGYNEYVDTNQSKLASPSGTQKVIQWTSGTQAWFEDIFLPYKSFQQAQGATSLTVCDLMAKSTDITQSFSFRTTGQGAVTGTQNLDQTFQYLGGYQKHTFVNSGNTTVFAEFVELHPRDCIVAEYIVGSDVKASSIGSLVLSDMLDNNTLNNLKEPIYTTTSYDNVNDCSVKISKNCKRVHNTYRVSKPVSVTIQPGCTFEYTVKGEPFTFVQSEFAQLFQPYEPDGTVVTGQVGTMPNYVPKFTKVLQARFSSELSHTSATSYVNVEPGPGSVMHTKCEYHHCRAVPFQAQNSTVIKYLIGTTGLALYHMDETNQDNEAFDG